MILAVRSRAALVVLPLSVLVIGCNRSPYELAPVTGMVRVDGQPLSTGKVMFAPVSASDAIESGKPAMGRLQPDGTFELSTYKQGDGAVVGSHWVTIYGPRKNEAEFPPGVPEFERVSVREGTMDVVTGQDNHFEIDIAAEDIRKFARKAD